MDGQTTDFRAGAGTAEPVVVGSVDAPPISWSPAPPVRVVETREVVDANRIAEDTWVLDFGQNASGWIRLTDLGPAGTRTVIDFGEHVGPDGDLDTSHLDSTKPGEPTVVFVQRDEVVSAGGGEVFEPAHTVHGFQFARVRREGAAFDPSTARMRIVQTDLRRTASFESSDLTLNRLHEIADWSFRGNAVDVPTDCPTRERLAWTGTTRSSRRRPRACTTCSGSRASGCGRCATISSTTVGSRISRLTVGASSRSSTISSR